MRLARCPLSIVSPSIRVDKKSIPMELALIEIPFIVASIIAIKHDTLKTY
jgi:hypothetical protein